jgi:hypothetical protein
VENETEEVLETTTDQPEEDTTEVESSEETAEGAEQETPEPEPAPETPEFDGDITKLSPEAQKIAKGFQASYTRKMQALQTAMEGLKSHEGRLKLLDRAIQGDKEARANLASMFGNQTQPANAAEDDMPEQFGSFKEMRDYFDKHYEGKMQQRVENILQQHIAPLVQHIQMQRAEAVINEARAKYKDFDSHVGQIIALREQNPGLSLDAAYKLARADSHPEVPPTARVTKPGKRPAAAVSKGPDKLLSWEEASAQALRELKGGR